MSKKFIETTADMEFSQFLAAMADLVSTKRGANTLNGNELPMYRHHVGRAPLSHGTPFAPRPQKPFTGREHAQPAKTPQTAVYRFTPEQMTIAIQAANNRKQTNK